MKKQQFILIACCIVFIFASFGIGVIIGALQLPPYSTLQSTYRNQFSGIAADNARYETIDPIYLKTNVSDLITLQQPRDIQTRRTAFIQHIWGKNTLPTDLPLVTRDIQDPLIEPMENLERIDSLLFLQPFNISSVSYHFVPQRRNGEVVIYHAGSGADFRSDQHTIAFFVREGYDVIALSMPLNGLNNQPLLQHSRFGTIQLKHRAHLKYLENSTFNPVQLFLTPVVVNTNYALTQSNTIHMVGLSGGGWTTTLSAAVDPRISHSYPVAGSLPIYLRSGVQSNWGRYQDVLPTTYSIANYPELYILGSAGENRSQMQVLNKYDSCCFAGITYQTYESIVHERSATLSNGTFTVLLDDTHRGHMISDYALEQIAQDMEQWRQQ